jgi:hypothetical protein
VKKDDVQIRINGRERVKHFDGVLYDRDDSDDHPERE